jgi:hypothetical protein
MIEEILVISLLKIPGFVLKELSFGYFSKLYIPIIIFANKNAPYVIYKIKRGAIIGREINSKPPPGPK